MPHDVQKQFLLSPILSQNTCTHFKISYILKENPLCYATVEQDNKVIKEIRLTMSFRDPKSIWCNMFSSAMVNGRCLGKSQSTEQGYNNTCSIF